MSVCCSCDDTLQKKNFKPKTLQGVAMPATSLPPGSIEELSILLPDFDDVLHQVIKLAPGFQLPDQIFRHQRLSLIHI